MLLSICSCLAASFSLGAPIQVLQVVYPCRGGQQAQWNWLVLLAIICCFVICVKSWLEWVEAPWTIAP